MIARHVCDSVLRRVMFAIQVCGSRSVYETYAEAWYRGGRAMAQASCLCTLLPDTHDAVPLHTMLHLRSAGCNGWLVCNAHVHYTAAVNNQ